MTASSLASNCEPELYLKYSDSSGEINPCGLVAWSFFNDSFSVSPAPSAVRSPRSNVFGLTIVKMRQQDRRLASPADAHTTRLRLSSIITTIRRAARCNEGMKADSVSACLPLFARWTFRRASHRQRRRWT